VHFLYLFSCAMSILVNATFPLLCYGHKVGGAAGGIVGANAHLEPSAPNLEEEEATASKKEAIAAAGVVIAFTYVCEGAHIILLWRSQP